jgi:hypothetical protein
VGQGAREEINFQPVTSTGDENYGWPCREGLIAYTNAPGYCGAAGLYDDPIDDYPSTGSPCNSVTGGYVYRGSMYPDMAGRYLYTDYCTGEWWAAYQATPGSWTVVYHTELTSLAFITTFGEGADGDLYVARSGSIYRVVQVPWFSVTCGTRNLIAGLQTYHQYFTTARLHRKTGAIQNWQRHNFPQVFTHMFKLLVDDENVEITDSRN